MSNTTLTEDLFPSNMTDFSGNNCTAEKYMDNSSMSNILHVWSYKRCADCKSCELIVEQEAVNTTTINSIVAIINWDYAYSVMPVIVFMVIVMAIGLIGNCVVIIIYWTKDNKPMANYFMLYLALVDFFSCLFCHPYVISKLFNFYNPSVIVCKVFEFLMHTSLSAQCGILLSIAIDRYYAVCCPVKFITSLKRNTWTLGILMVMAVVFSLPILVLYGRFTIPVKWNKLTLYVGVCHSNDKYDGSILQKVFGSVIMSMMIGELITMVILYSKMSYRVISGRKRLPPPPAHNEFLSTPLITEPYLQTALKEKQSVKHNPRNKIHGSVDSEVDKIETLPSLNKNCSDNISTGMRDEDTNMKLGCTPNNKRGLKTAKMLFLVTLVFFLSWLPFWVLKIITIVSPYITWDVFEHNVILKFLYHLFYINNAVNPIIYTFINRHFIVDIRNFIRKYKRHNQM